MSRRPSSSRRLSGALLLALFTAACSESTTAPTQFVPQNSLRTTSLMPSENVPADWQVPFTLELAYELVDGGEATVTVWVNDEEADVFRQVASRLVQGSAGDISILFEAVPRDWGMEGEFLVQVRLQQDGGARVRQQKLHMEILTDPSGYRRAVETQHLANIRAFLRGDADAFSEIFAPDVVDWGGGSQGNGTLPPEYTTPAYWEAFFASAEFQEQFAGRVVEEFLDVSRIRAFTRREAEVIGPVSSPHFEAQDDDMLAVIPPLEGSAMFDGWFGIYRRYGGQWLIAAID